MGMPAKSDVHEFPAIIGGNRGGNYPQDRGGVKLR